MGLKLNQKKIQLTLRKIKDAQLRQIKDSLKLNDWSDLYNLKDVNEAYAYLLNTLKSVIDNIAPEKQIIITKSRLLREPWVTTGLLKSSSTLDKLYKRSMNKHKDHPFYVKFKKYRNTYNCLKRTMKQKYYHDLLTKYKRDCRQKWGVLIKSLVAKHNDKSNVCNSFLIDGQEISNPRRTFLRIVVRILPRSSSRSLVFRFDGLLCKCICLCLFGIVVYLFAHIHRV